jgi:chemotaxis signal transduction protein
MSPQSNGWLLELRGPWRAAIGLRELIHVLPYSPRLHMVPQAPLHARHVLLWEGKVVPVLDLAAYLEAGAEFEPGTATNRPSFDHLVGIVAYQAGSGVGLGGMLLGKVPERVCVTDEQACALPESPVGWQRLAISCFRHPDHGAVPILDLPGLFCRRLPAPGVGAPDARTELEAGPRWESLAARETLSGVAGPGTAASPPPALLGADRP